MHLLRTGATIDYRRLDEILSPVYEELELPPNGVAADDPGRSRGDLRATVVGLALGEASRRLDEGSPDSVFSDRAEFSAYVERNVGQPDASESEASPDAPAR